MLFVTLVAIVASLSARKYEIHAYRSYEKPRMEKMVLIGQVTARTKVTNSTRRRMLDYDTREMVITGRLYDHENLRLGDKVFLIEKDPEHKKYKNGYVVGEGIIFSIFKTEFQGWMLKANGNFSMVKKGHFIARKDNARAQHEALVLLKQGDKYRSIGDTARALENYNKSIQKDKNRPETYLQLALEQKKLGRNELSRKYLHEAFKRLNKFTDINSALLLPSLYMNAELEYIEAARDPQVTSSKDIRKWQLKKYLALLKDVRHYQSSLTWFRQSFRKDILELLLAKGVPQYDFQFYKAVLFENIYAILKQPYSFKVTSHKRILEWLSPAEREILYHEIKLPGAQQKFVHPKKAWDEAYFQAAIYHFKLAHDELNHLDTRAAYHIVQMCIQKYRSTSNRILKKDYATWIMHYGSEFLRVPSKPREMTIVRNLVNSVKNEQH